MKIWVRIAVVAAIVLVGVGGAAAVRTVALGSRQIPAHPVPPQTLDTLAAGERLAGAVRFRTISFDGIPDASADAFLALHEYLARQFPLVHQTLKLETVGKYSLLYTWPGSDTSLDPVMFMAHQDVVPIASGTEDRWLHDPFGGVISDGYVWGRGSWDDKSNLTAVLEALETLIASGVKPKRTIILASGHDEEIGGKRGARAIAALLRERGVKPAFVIDEGQIITEGVVRGVTHPVAFVGLAEKGSATFLLTAEGQSAHSSMPSQHSVIGALGGAIYRLETDQMPAKLAGVVRESFETLAPEMSGFNRVMLSNLWLTEPLVRTRLEKQPSLNAILRTTTAPTIINGGNKANVMPGLAKAVVNFRILPGDTVASVERHVREVVADPSITVSRIGEGRNPSPVSSSNSAAYGLISQAIRDTFPDVVVVPNLVVANTDARYMSALTPSVYRFVPIRAKLEDLARFHGTNERISLSNYAEEIRFYLQLINIAGIEGR
jgi:carboxypeptidase PM20D1